MVDVGEISLPEFAIKRSSAFMDVVAELRPIGVMYRDGNIQDALAQLTSLWLKVPDPKPETPNAYLIIEYGVAFALKGGDLDRAQEWADRASMFAEKRHDMGEVEFLVGKVAFERGDLRTASEQFIIADAKSEGRVFEAKDERYRRLIDGPKLT
ncbi:hypothetical protein NSE01_21110 [Novosphingobium sediminis]|uniref:MalT-like TPR region domain-containing protein n=1 Tax=Novosphingobium sediminis TaxID=707214 RepID=A0A512AKN9_9SPHN|nr:hypothetical protein [Novosphingobium sediminis]GEO00279.1 hypothetical protein NSE01_21110 [Novosphingobium sediminis]